MKALIIVLILLSGVIFFFRSGLFAQGTPGSLAYNPYKDYPVYTGSDLGIHYAKSGTILKIWSPPAQEMKLKLYKTSTGSDLIEEVSCVKDASGVWKAELSGDHKNCYYTFQAKIDGKWNDENPDPYAKAVGINGKRGQIIDLSETNPEGWEKDQAPVLKSPTDIILYELHVRDLSIAANSGIQHKGKFLGLTETGTKNTKGQSTGIDQIADLGVTHVHLLTSFDFCSVDES
ncbi:MAG: type I pullulanase, partial [Bacteroidota bacterium]